MTLKYNELAQSAPSRNLHSPVKQEDTAKMTELEQRLGEYRLSIEQLKEERQEYERTMSLCQSEKEQIKLRAEQLLSMLQELKAEEEEP
jgi:DNA repair exonuclease SbcCD ATPase subunit